MTKRRLVLLAPAVRQAVGGMAERSERRRLEEAVQASQAIMRVSLDAMPDPFVICTAVRDDAGAIVDFRVAFANRAAGTFIGIEPEQLTGREIATIAPGIFGSPVLASCIRVVEEGATWSENAVEVRTALPGDIGLAMIDITVAPYEGGFFAVWRDVTEREGSKRALEASEARTRELVNESLDGILISGSDGRYVDTNPAMCRMLGYSHEELLSMRAGDLTATDDPVGNTRMSDRLHEAAGPGVLVERRYQRKDGTSLPVEVAYRVLPEGRQQRNVRDISDRQRLSRERDRLVAVVEQSRDIIAITDAAGRLEYVNPAFEAASGRKKSDLEGLPIQAVRAAALFEPSTAKQVDRSVMAGEPWSGETEHRAADGTTRRVELSVTPVRDQGGAISGWVNVMHDVTDLRNAEAEIALQGQVRALLAETLHNIPTEAGVEETAQAICDRLASLPFVDLVAIHVFLGPETARVLGQSGRSGVPMPADGLLLPARSVILQARGATGPWAEYVTINDADGWLPALVHAGVKAMAYGPISHGKELVGDLVIGTTNEDFARTLVEKLPGIVSTSTTSSALLAERLHAMRRAASLHRDLTTVLDEGAFHPVFQPIIDLASSETVGFEALTRFDSGQRPDLCFADAWSVGLGADLEFATLQAAIDAARGLRPGPWLNLNVSPRLLADPERLRPVLWSADRPIVLEVTEHEVIDDYEAVRAAVRQLGRDIRLAVDDAGSGVANFGHIIDLRPDFVKLDISLVRRVNANLGRQALVVGMRHFSRTAGCRLIAEGIETAEEARTLAVLGVEFGQGYHYGRPAPADTWTMTHAAKTAQGGSLGPTDDESILTAVSGT